MLRAVALALTTLSACMEDTKASKARAGTSTGPACKACCRLQGDKNYTFHWTKTKHMCMCEL